jgi:phage terminase large subunit GpA-like protein
MQAFVNNYLALPYSLEQAGIEMVSDAAIENATDTYQRNTVPAWVKALVLGADVQGDCAYYVIIGFGAASKAGIISWGRIASEMELPRIARQLFSHPSGAQMRVVGGGVDARYKSESVFDVCRTYRVLRPVQGQETITEVGRQTPIPFKIWTPDKTIKNKTPVNALQGLAVNTHFFKQIIYGRLNPQDGVERLLFLPVDSDEMLTRHLQSEHEIADRVRGAAGVKRKWVKRKGYDDNHLLDCTVYAFAVAHALKIFRLADDAPIYGRAKTEEHTETEPEKQVAAPPKIPARRSYLPLARNYLGK